MRLRVLLLASLLTAFVAAICVTALPSLRNRVAAIVPGHAAAAAEAGNAIPPKRNLQGTFQKAPPQPALMAPSNPSSITASGTSLFGWALLDRGTGAVVGSANDATVHNTTESMIKPWIASDFLRRLAEQGKQPTQAQLGEITLMLIDSNDAMAEKYYRLGGTNAVTNRLISICGLTSVIIRPYYWAGTQMTPTDALKYGQCVADGRAAGPQWTAWILDTMKHVRGGVKDQVSTTVQGGRWGIIDGLPPDLAAQTSIKNGWTLYGDGWHVNCLAIIGSGWVLNIMLRTQNGLQAAANVCQSVTQKLVVQPVG
jgi:hypothetical protein